MAHVRTGTNACLFSKLKLEAFVYANLIEREASESHESAISFTRLDLSVLKDPP